MGDDPSPDLGNQLDNCWPEDVKLVACAEQIDQASNYRQHRPAHSGQTAGGGPHTAAECFEVLPLLFKSLPPSILHAGILLPQKCAHKCLPQQLGVTLARSTTAKAAKGCNWVRRSAGGRL